MKTMGVLRRSSGGFIVGKMGLLSIPVLLGAVMSCSAVYATDDSVVDEINITVPVSCSLSGTGMNTHNAEIPNGTYQANIGSTTLKAFCNDANGFAIYAAGYTGNEIGDTNSNKLVGTNASSNATIVTGLATTAGNPDVSNWAMKLTLGTDSGDTTGTNALTIDSAPNEVNGSDASFSQYHTVPNEYTKVAHKNSATNMDTTNGGATLTTTYAAYISKTQPADTYSGQVIYTLVHPGVDTPTTLSLYHRVAMMSKGTQTLADLREEITTENSGVYEYNASVFGRASDASNQYPIYYYRGILDSNMDGTTSTIGSSGDSELWPDYVKIDDTCWRIVRTTGSGGVKMIYNGLYSGGTTEGSCANDKGDENLAKLNFAAPGNSEQSDWQGNVHYVGYTFNDDVTDSSVQASVDVVFGSNENYTATNTTDSNVKDYIENTWFANNFTDHIDILEPSAGYCNDRTIYDEGDTPSELRIIIPYSTTERELHFGSYLRNREVGGMLTLTCPTSRNIVDLYTTNLANNGNKQLKYPVALLTADEVALAGIGGGDGYSSVKSNDAYIYSLGTMTLSPSNNRSSMGSGGIMSANSYNLIMVASLIHEYTVGSYSTPVSVVRPVISLKSNISPVSGQGTAVDPWVIDDD